VLDSAIPVKREPKLSPSTLETHVTGSANPAPHSAKEHDNEEKPLGVMCPYFKENLDESQKHHIDTGLNMSQVSIMSPFRSSSVHFLHESQIRGLGPLPRNAFPLESNDVELCPSFD
jgi:hypothetical protein